MCLSLILGIVGLLVDPEFCGVVRGARYGEIRIVGNTDTPRRVIHSMLDIEPGAKVTLGKFQPAVMRLQGCSTLQTDPMKGFVPMIEFDPNPNSEYWDVRVQVQDRRGSWLGYELVDVGWYSIEAIIFRDATATLKSLKALQYIVARVNQ